MQFCECEYNVCPAAHNGGVPTPLPALTFPDCEVWRVLPNDDVGIVPQHQGSDRVTHQRISRRFVLLMNCDPRVISPAVPSTSVVGLKVWESNSGHLKNSGSNDNNGPL